MPVSSMIAGMLAAAIALGAPALAAGQAPLIRPGLWETTLSGDVAELVRQQTGEMEAALKDLPPDERAKIRESINAQIDSFGTPEKSCIGAEEAASFWKDQLEGDDCRRAFVWSAPGRGVMSAQCQGGRTETAQVTMNGADKLSIVTRIRAPSRPAIEYTTTLRRLGSDCGMRN